jgi:predicted  nucleic acid-binding Zn-ribbon protein
MKRLLTLLTLMCLLGPARQALAQLPLGNVSGNYNATQSMLLNPAQVYPDRNRVYIHGWNYAAEFNNNLVRFERPFSLWNWTGNDLRLANMEAMEPGKDRYLNYLSTSQILSFSFRYARNHAFGFSTRTVQGISMVGVGDALSLIGRNGLDTSLANGPGRGLMRNRDYTNGAFSLNTDNYQEFSFTFGWASGRNSRHFLKTGFTGKVLIGFGAAHVSGRDLDFRFNSRDTLLLRSGSYRTGHTGEASVNNALSNPLGLWFNEVSGAGLGLDLGFTYEYRPEKLRGKRNRWNCLPDDNRDYRFRLGASVSDIGFITYSGASTREVTLSNQIWRINPGLMQQRYDVFQPDRFDAVDNDFTDALGTNVKESEAFTTFTPASFNAQLDYNIGNGWHLGGHWVQNLRSKEGIGLQKMSQVSLVPRYERENFEFGMPLSLTGNYSRFTWGLYGRWGPFILGSDNLGGLSGMAFNGQFTGSSFYGGVRFKLNPCWFTYNDYIDPVADTTWLVDSTILTDSVIIEEPVLPGDTVYIEKTVRDTVYIQTTNTVLATREAEIKRREEDLKRREAEILARENKGGTGNCCGEVATLRTELDQTRNNNARLQAQVNTLLQEKKTCEDGSRGQVTTINTYKEENARINARLKDARDENTRLQAEVNRLRTVQAGTPCGRQTKTLDSLLAVERQERSRIAAELSQTRTDRDILKGENNTLKTRITELEKQVNDCRGSSTVTAEVNRLRNENSDLRNRNIQLENDLSRERAASSTINAEVNRLRGETSQQRLRISQLEADLNRCRTEAGGSATQAGEISRLKKESDNQRLRIAELEAQNKKCGDERSTVTAEVNRLRTENTQLSTDLTQCRTNGASSTVTAEINRLKKDNDDQRLRIAELEAQNKKCGEERGTVTAEVNRLKTENTQLSNDLSLCRTNGASSTVTAEVNRLKKDNDDQRLRISQLEADVNKCGQENSTVKAEVNKLKTENSQLKATVTELDAKLKNGSSSSAEVNDLRLKNEQLTTQLNAVKAEYQFCMDESKTLRSKITELEGKLKAAESNTGNSSELQAQVNTLKTANTDLDNRLKAVMAEYKFCSDESKTLKSKIAELEGKLKAAESNTGNSSELQAQVNTLKSENSNLETRMNELSAENKTLKDQSAQQLARVKTLEADVAKYKLCCDNTEKSGNNSEAIQNELNVLKQEYEQLRVQNNSNRDRARTLESEATALKARIAALESQLAECQKSNGNGSGEGSAPREGGSSGSRALGEIIRNSGTGSGASGASGGTSIRRPTGTVSQPQSSGGATNTPSGNGGTIRQPQPAAPSGRPAPGAPANAPSAKPEGRPAPPSGSPTNDRG